MLRHLVELVDRVVDLANAVRLLGCGRGDLANDVADPLHRPHDLVHGAARVLNQRGTGGYLAHRRVDQRLNLFGCLGTALGQAAHLAGHHCKAAALLTSAGGLYCCVERQDIGLKRDAINDADDVSNLARTLVNVFHGRDHLAHYGPTARGHLGGGRR